MSETGYVFYNTWCIAQSDHVIASFDYAENIV